MKASDTLLYEAHNDRAVVTLNRPEKRNSINEAMLTRFHAILDEVEADPAIRTLIVRGSEGVFCSGMDLGAFVSEDAFKSADNPYMGLLKRFAATDKVVISHVEGTVMAGGVGIAAASDLVFADPTATFSLSEVLWGLLPAMVMPFLIRRVGFQCAYRLTLTTSTINADQARAMNLVDELGEDIEARLQAMTRRLGRLHPQTVVDMKRYFRKMWMIDETMEQTAINELVRLSKEARVVANISDFVNHGKVPWE